MKIYRKPLIRFYDEKIKGDTGHGSHVSALTALYGEDLILGLLLHYWEKKKILLLKYIRIPAQMVKQEVVG